MTTWLRRAEDKAGLEPQEGSLWQPHRRLWASSRTNLPDVDVAQAGGWSSLEALKLAYQRPDDETITPWVTHDSPRRGIAAYRKRRKWLQGDTEPGWRNR